jgi:hypothetical protein
MGVQNKTMPNHRKDIPELIVINPDESIASLLPERTLKKAKKDFAELFFMIVGEARQIAARQLSANTKLTIDDGAWEQAKWKVFHEQSKKRGRKYWIAKFIGVFASSFFGWGISELSSNSWAVWIAIFSTIIFGISFFFEYTMENEL